MATERIKLRNVNIDEQIKNFGESEASMEDKKDIIDFVRDLRLGKITGRPVSDDTLSVYLSSLQRALEYIKKATSKLTEKDIDSFWEDMLRDKMNHKINATAYSDAHKLQIRNTLLMYLNWKLEDKSLKITKSLRSKFRVKRKTIEYLTQQKT